MGCNEHAKKVQKPLRDIFDEIQIALNNFAYHNHLLQLFNQFWHSDIICLLIPPSPDLNQDANEHRRKLHSIILSNFSAQIDMIPIRKVNCHVNLHASLDFFVQFFQNFVDIDGEVLYFVECIGWYFFGSCEEKGKQNDWIMHHASFIAIINDPLIRALMIESYKLYTDNLRQVN